MVGFCKRYAFLTCCVLLMGFMSAGDVIRLPQIREETVAEKIVWKKVPDQRIAPPADNAETGSSGTSSQSGSSGTASQSGSSGTASQSGSSGTSSQSGAAVRLSDEKEAYLQRLASRQGQANAAAYRAVLAEYEADKNIYDIVLFGDSLTYRGDWSGLSDRMTIANRGINGDMIEGLEHRVDQLILMKPRALFLLIGINDLSVRMRPQVCEMYGRLLDELMRELPDTEIYVQSILPVRDDLRDIMSNDAIALVNVQIKKMCDARGLCYIDVYTEMLNPEERRLYYNYQLDGLHLSEQGYDVWKRVIKPYISGVEWRSAVEGAEKEKSRWRAASAPNAQ